MDRMLTRWRSNDPKHRDAVIYNSDYNHLEKIVSTLQVNTVIEQLRFYFIEEEDDDRRVWYVPLLKWIRTRTQLKELTLTDLTMRQDASEFLMAASQNRELEILNMAGIYVYSTESLGTLRSHPNLKQLCFSVDTQDMNLDRFETFGQIISTCPQLRTLQFELCTFSAETWNPLCDAMCQLPHSNMLKLEFPSCIFDAEATLFLRNFLRECPNPLHLQINMSSVYLASSEDFNADDPSWLARLIGPSVQALTVYYRITVDQFMEFPLVNPCLTSLMNSCRDTLQKLELVKLNKEDDYQALLKEIPNLIALKEIKIEFAPSIGNIDSGYRKSQYVDALSQNMSITKVHLKDCDFLHPTLLKSAIVQLRYFRRRNEGFSRLMDSPGSIPIGAWPMVWQAVPNTSIGTFFIYQSMRKIMGSLPQTFGWNDDNITVQKKFCCGCILC